MSTLTVVAKLKAKAGSEEALFSKLQALVAPTLAEKGCLSYDLHRSGDDAGLFFFTERWESRPLWEDHMKAPHLAAFGETQGEVTESWDLFTGEKV